MSNNQNQRTGTGIIAGMATASSEEVARFAAIADAWWDPYGEFRPLHRLNPTRIAYIRNRIAEHFGRDPLAPRPLDGLRILDVGCGGGLVTEPMARLGASVTGIDADGNGVRVAEAHAQKSGLKITYRKAVPEDLSGTEEPPFDAVVSMEVVEHVSDPRAFLAVCADLLRPGGILILATLNRTLKSLALAKIGAEYILRWLPAGTHDWRKFVRPSELAAGLRRCGLQVEDLTGMRYNPLADQWSLSTTDLDINYLVCATKPSSKP
ncbi:MAG: bifunctional 2-polyprenyl-6-hydroxyphenol methylase/3-demethylubiquinol 3-O-methyltransferase UbiG [Hyphomicrobium sp.]